MKYLFLPPVYHFTDYEVAYLFLPPVYHLTDYDDDDGVVFIMQVVWTLMRQ